MIFGLLVLAAVAAAFLFSSRRRTEDPSQPARAGDDQPSLRQMGDLEYELQEISRMRRPVVPLKARTCHQCGIFALFKVTGDTCQACEATIGPNDENARLRAEIHRLAAENQSLREQIE